MSFAKLKPQEHYESGIDEMIVEVSGLNRMNEIAFYIDSNNTSIIKKDKKEEFDPELIVLHDFPKVGRLSFYKKSHVDEENQDSAVLWVKLVEKKEGR